MALNLPRQKVTSVKILIGIVSILLTTVGYYFYSNTRVLSSLRTAINGLTEERDQNKALLENTQKELSELKGQDQLKRNDELQKEIENIQKTYNKALVSYEDLLEFKTKQTNTKELDELFASALGKLAKRDYEGANKDIDTLNTKIKEESAKLATTVTIPASVPQNNNAPGTGYARQQVTTEAGTFMVSLVAGDLSSTRVIVDTASESDCANNCPVLPLATYVSRNGAYAGVNGSYFCPSTYPTCAGKTNSFDLLVMNKNKTYFNSSNNVYSNNPGVIFGGGYIRFVSSVSQWGRDTGIDSMLSNYPLLVQGGNVAFGGDDDPKKGSKGNRSFVANKGNTVYIGVVHNATVAESARVMKALGMENALNLDSGGSTALWSGGYKVGPGRDLPNVILFVKK